MYGRAFVSARDMCSTLRKNENKKNERCGENGRERRDRFSSAFVLVSLSLRLFSVAAYSRFRASSFRK